MCNILKICLALPPVVVVALLAHLGVAVGVLFRHSRGEDELTAHLLLLPHFLVAFVASTEAGAGLFMAGASL